MTRNGKIARLPREIRNQLNQRLRDGEMAIQLVEWLNSLPEVQAVLAAQFEGRAINEQNVSEWRAGGYRDWERQQEARGCLQELAGRTEGWEEEIKSEEISQRLTMVLAVELARASQALLEQELPPAERWKQLRELLREVQGLRGEDRRGKWLGMQCSRWEAREAQERFEREQAEEEMRKKRRGELSVANAWLEELLMAIRARKAKEAADKSAIDKGDLSGSIKPDQTESK